ncbi:MAG: hypothetical protein Q4D73_06355 [Actinomycetaceae bacterium]|nr:hypothetical protein [Actinomycetaceae bacterium]
MLKKETVRLVSLLVAIVMTGLGIWSAYGAFSAAPAGEVKKPGVVLNPAEGGSSTSPAEKPADPNQPNEATDPAKTPEKSGDWKSSTSGNHDAPAQPAPAKPAPAKPAPAPKQNAPVVVPPGAPVDVDDDHDDLPDQDDPYDREDDRDDPNDRD